MCDSGIHILRTALIQRETEYIHTILYLNVIAVQVVTCLHGALLVSSLRVTYLTYNLRACLCVVWSYALHYLEVLNEVVVHL